MFKLIMADIKVLGHRIWAIPLGAFILVSILSLIPNVNMPDPVRYFMIALFSPGLLIFELINQDLKRNSERMIMTLPMSKRTYVIGKYLTVLLLSLTAIPAGWFSYILHTFTQNKMFSVTQSISFIPGMLEAMGPILLFVYFILPIYYYTKKLKTSIIIGLLILWPIGYELLGMIFKYFYSIFFSNNIKNFLYSFLIVIVAAIILHLIIKYFFKSVSNKWIHIGWFTVILQLGIISFEILTQNLEYTHVFMSVLQKLDTATGENRERYLEIIKNYKYYISIFSISLISCITILTLMIKRSKDKLQLFSVIYLFSPMIMFVVIAKIYLLLKPLYDEKGYFGDIREYGSYSIALLIGLILYFFFSAKASIYLLKNNRTLK